MKKISRVLAIVLALVMVLSGSVFAAWVSFQNDNTNNGVITSNAPIGRIIATQLQLPSGGYVGIDVPPVVDSEGYAYILESAQSTTRLMKVNLNTKTVVNTGVWDGGIQVRDVSAFQLSTPVIDGNYIYVATTDFAQQNADASFQTLVSGTSAWTLTNNNPNNAHPPFFTQDDGFVKVTDNQSTTALNFTLSQTFTGVAGDNLRIECTALGSALTTGTLKVYLNNSTTPLINLDLSAQVGYAVNQSVSNSALVTGSNTLKIEIIANAGSSAVDPYVYLGTFRFFEENGAVARYDRSSGAKEVIVNNIPGQLNTPLSIRDDYLYFGSYYAGGGKYYQADLLANSFPTTPEVFESGVSHYWSGAYVSATRVYFGGYEGKLFYPRVDHFSSDTGCSIDVGYGSITATDICSSICFNDNKLYFTSKNGYLWCYSLNNQGVPSFSWYVDLEAPSTSTPVVSPSGNIYVGTYSGFTNGKVYAVQAPTSKGVVGTKYEVFSGKPVQSSVIVMNDSSNTANDYIYFTTNSSDGAGYCYHVVTANFTDPDHDNATLEWNTLNKPLQPQQYDNTYTLQGMAAYGNCVVFGNDHSMLYIVNINPNA